MNFHIPPSHLLSLLPALKAMTLWSALSVFNQFIILKSSLWFHTLEPSAEVCKAEFLIIFIVQYLKVHVLSHLLQMVLVSENCHEFSLQFCFPFAWHLSCVPFPIFIPEQPPVVSSPRHLTLWVRVLPSRPWTILGYWSQQPQPSESVSSVWWLGSSSVYSHVQTNSVTV